MKIQKWNEIRKGSKITLLKETSFPSLGGSVDIIPAGQYYICGFWVNACGIAKEKNTLNEYVIPSKLLTKFENITE